MTKIPNVDWEAIKHPTSALEDNMRHVRNQLGGSPTNARAWPPDERPEDRLGHCDCPYGWHAIHGECHPAPLWPAYDGNPSMGVGETIFSSEEIAQFQKAAQAVYTESMNKVQAANEKRTQEGRYPFLPSQFNDIARLEMQKLANERRFLEGDTEFSDADVEDYYLGKAPT